MPTLPAPPNPIDVINRAPDDSLETRIIKRQGWALYLGITLALFAGATVLGAVLHVQSAEASECAALVDDLRTEWGHSQSVLLAQLNDRLDTQAQDLMRCRDHADRLHDEMRELEAEFRDKLATTGATL